MHAVRRPTGHVRRDERAVCAQRQTAPLSCGVRGLLLTSLSLSSRQQNVSLSDDKHNDNDKEQVVSHFSQL